MHTPGPWQRSRFVDQPRYGNMGHAWKQQRKAEEEWIVRGPGLVGDAACNPVARVLTFNEADARLIAAAPDLLRALKRIVLTTSTLAGMDYLEDDLIHAQHVIAKAEGRAEIRT